MSYQVPAAAGGSGLTALQRLQMAQAEATAPKQPQIPSGQMPGGQAVSEMSAAMRLIQQAQATAAVVETQENLLLKQIVDAIKSATVGTDALEQLRCNGVLQIEVRFRSNSRVECNPKTVSWVKEIKPILIPLENYNKITLEQTAGIEGMLKKEVDPKYFESTRISEQAYKNAPWATYLDRILMIVSDCRQELHMNQSGEVIKKAPIYDSHVHQPDVTETQTVLHQTELTHQNALVSMDKVIALADSLIKIEGAGAFASMFNDIKSGRVQGMKLWVRLQFNNPPNDIPRQDGKYYPSYHSGFKLEEITALFQILKDNNHFGKLPLCHFTTKVYSDSDNSFDPQTCFVAQGKGIKSQCEIVVADYMFQN